MRKFDQHIFIMKQITVSKPGQLHASKPLVSHLPARQVLALHNRMAHSVRQPASSDQQIAVCCCTSQGTTDVSPAAAEPESIMLSEQPSPEELQADEQYLAGAIADWLDDEWTPLSVHRELGVAAGQAYTRVRREGERELGAVLLGITNELLTFDFTETFVDPFAVGNKAAALLMERMGREVAKCG